ncbi:hypothetical protein K438DRAFT_1821835 [Mycena galopus ATCC 62051]|nr:hypothetical protein K438DRAFT_1821835 [Mycena galopus ATCC 62051]
MLAACAASDFGDCAIIQRAERRMKTHQMGKLKNGSHSFRRESTWYGGRGLFAIQDIPKDTLLHTCPSPYASVIYRVFRKEVCGLCFAYSFDARRNAWNIKLEAVGSGIWFCTETCRDDWIRDENIGQLVEEMNAAVDGLAKKMDKAAAGHVVLPPVPSVKPTAITQESIDSAWTAAENAAVRTGSMQHGSAPEPVLSEMELDTVRFVLSAIVRRYIQDSLQNNELQFYRGRPAALASHLSIYTFIRRVILLSGSKSLLALQPYLATSEIVRAVLGRDPGNVFGMYEMNDEGDSEMLGWCMYVSASYFNHDCTPNIRKQRVGRELHFYTTKDVTVGDELCISYIDTADDVAERRKQLSANWYFDCVCDRCKAESEQEEIE